MDMDGEHSTDLTTMAVPRVGRLVTGDEREPYRLIDEAGVTVTPVSE